MKKTKNIFVLGPFTIMTLMMIVSCTEPFVIPLETSGGALVVDARITDENNYQIVELSRTVPLDSTQIHSESGAEVTIFDNESNQFVFVEGEKGKYVSENTFAAVPGRIYELKIKTRNGESYTSSEVQAPPRSTIERLYAERGFRDSLEQGVFILLDNDEPSDGAKFYKFEYEETYKVMAPFWVPEEAYIVNFQPTISGAVQTAVRIRSQEERVCYPSETSRRIIQGNTVNLLENGLQSFPVRFIGVDNYILSYRYSILVKQYTQSEQAYKFYETLSKLSSVENVFSQIQTGFFEGNISNDSNVMEPVLGYFEVCSVDEKRIFLDFEDIFPEERRPDFPFRCDFSAPLTGLRSSIEFEFQEFYELNDPPDPNFSEGGPYIMVTRVCGDCTVLGTNVKPEYWIE